MLFTCIFDGYVCICFAKKATLSNILACYRYFHSGITSVNFLLSSFTAYSVQTWAATDSYRYLVFLIFSMNRF